MERHDQIHHPLTDLLQLRGLDGGLEVSIVFLARLANVELDVVLCRPMSV
jgi:hypothetical protein